MPMKNGLTYSKFRTSLVFWLKTDFFSSMATLPVLTLYCSCGRFTYRGERVLFYAVCHPSMLQDSFCHDAAVISDRR